jgi:hypothetical protein
MESTPMYCVKHYLAPLPLRGRWFQTKLTLVAGRASR